MPDKIIYYMHPSNGMIFRVVKHGTHKHKINDALYAYRSEFRKWQLRPHSWVNWAECNCIKVEEEYVMLELL